VAKTTEKTSKAIVEIRKAPRIIPFVATAAVVGLVVSAITAAAIQAPGHFVGYVIGWGTVVFAAIGLFVSVVLEAIFRTRTKRLEATKIEG
ncbi:MAG: hypothetical protein RL085_386, partial [Actinomycetota bacterium]|jgi:uncharacterized membrane protein YczE